MTTDSFNIPQDFPAPATGGTLGVEVTRVRIGAVELALIAEPIEPINRRHALTRAEHEVARSLLGGHSNQEIALARGTSVRTVANQVAAIFRKLGVKSRAELAAFRPAPGSSPN